MPRDQGILGDPVRAMAVGIRLDSERSIRNDQIDIAAREISIFGLHRRHRLLASHFSRPARGVAARLDQACERWRKQRNSTGEPPPEPSSA
jgi:hypothetical protein